LNWTETKNLKSVSLGDIPQLHINELRTQIIDGIKNGRRLVQFFGDTKDGHVILYAVLADDFTSRLFIASSKFGNEKEYQSITPEIPAAHLFEREFYEQLGVEPKGHPWLKPVRKGIALINDEEIPYNFFNMTGEEMHEVGVGPIHAGVIEPGHFRFSCHGEKVYYLEIEHGFQHRGIENLFVKNYNKPLYLTKLSESIAGDTVIGHAGAFVRAMESLGNTFVSRRAQLIRTIMLELERIAVHLGDLSALSGDVAYLTGNSVFGALRTKIINTTMAICGNRFGRGIMTIGGINYDISSKLESEIKSTLNRLSGDVDLAAEVLFSSASVLERFEQTGVIEKETALEIGMVGPAARSSGVSLDIRSDHPFDAYQYFTVHKLTLESGDVFARAYMRFIEIQHSIRIILEQLANLPEGELKSPVNSLQSDGMVVSLAEGWRGEIAHVIITNSSGNIKRVKIKDPSFHNWFALALAVREEGISDFPLCNKSFNLSYSGTDL
jgi:Ni,Fe-hydrogenase III large subunit